MKRRGLIPINRLTFAFGAVIAALLLGAWALGMFDRLYTIVLTEVSP